MGSSSIFSSFEICLVSWPPCFMKHFFSNNNKFFLNFITNLQGQGFLLFVFVSDVYIPHKANVVEGQLSLGFNNAFAFTLYFKMFPPFVRCTPFIMFLNGGYNFSLRGFLLESIVLSLPFFSAH